MKTLIPILLVVTIILSGCSSKLDLVFSEPVSAIEHLKYMPDEMVGAYISYSKFDKKKVFLITDSTLIVPIDLIVLWGDLFDLNKLGAYNLYNVLMNHDSIQMSLKTNLALKLQHVDDVMVTRKSNYYFINYRISYKNQKFWRVIVMEKINQNLIKIQLASRVKRKKRIWHFLSVEQLDKRTLVVTGFKKAPEKLMNANFLLGTSNWLKD